MSKGMEPDLTADARRQAVGKKIRQRRLRKVGNQEALATLLEVSQAKISRMERGQTEPDHYERLALAKHLGGRPGDYRALE